jgi:hypothetical protein
MVAATPSLPELSPREAHLLAVFLILRYDFVALAENEKLQPGDLLAFAQSPAVTAHLAAFKAFSETAFALRHLEARIKSLDILEKIATTSESPIEQRRAASTIFRGIGLQRQSPSEPSGASRRSLAPCSPSEGGPAIHNISPSLRDRVGGREPEAHCAPRAVPSPQLSPADIINALTASLAESRRPASAATLLAFLAGAATINNQPATPATLQTLISKHIPATPVVQVQIGDDTTVSPGPPETFTTHIYLIHDGGRQIRINTTLTREPTGRHPHSWLLSALHIGPKTG